jgi:hypothetical protein
MIREVNINYVLSALLLISTVAGAPNPVSAATIQPYSCRNGLFPAEQASLELARVTRTAKRLYFYRDEENCPNSEATCKTKNYLVGGDEVIVKKSVDGWSCAWFQGKRNETVGWMRGDGLRFLTTPPPPKPAEWLGTWRFHEDGSEIVIRAKDDKLAVTGSSLWHGLVLDDGTQVVHTGELDGEMKPSGNRARLGSPEKEYECVVDFTLLGRYLIVTDNSNCGGVNVRFDGVYTKSGK